MAEFLHDLALYSGAACLTLLAVAGVATGTAMAWGRAAKAWGINWEFFVFCRARFTGEWDRFKDHQQESGGEMRHLLDIVGEEKSDA